MKKVSLDDDSNDFTKLIKSRFQPECLPKHERKWQVFKYEDPQGTNPKKKVITRLCTTDIAIATMQKLDEGGESKMHSHAAQDGFFMVLEGSAVFTGENGEEVTLGPRQGMMLPRGVPYAFRKTGNEPLLLLQVEAMHSSAKSNSYQVLEERAPQSERLELYDAKL